MDGVSVVIPAHNAARFLSEALDSVFSQGLRDPEVVVVDDGSTDGTADLARSYGRGVRVLCVERSGSARARNRPKPPLRVRVRVALGSLRRVMNGSGGISDAETKTHPLTQDGLNDLVNSRFLIESCITEGSVMFLRALKQNLSSPRIPGRKV